MGVGTIWALKGSADEDCVSLGDTRGRSASVSVVVHPHRLIIPRNIKLVMNLKQHTLDDPLSGRLQITGLGSVADLSCPIVCPGS